MQGDFYNEVAGVTLSVYQPTDASAMESAKAVILEQALQGKTSAHVIFNDYVERELKREGFRVLFLRGQDGGPDFLEAHWVIKRQ